MSGGHFDYIQYRLSDVEDQLQNLIKNDEEWIIWSPETIQRFEECLYHLKKANVMLHRIDWLVSADDSEETFHVRLNDELKCGEHEREFIESAKVIAELERKIEDQKDIINTLHDAVNRWWIHGDNMSLYEEIRRMRTDGLI